MSSSVKEIANKSPAKKRGNPNWKKGKSGNPKGAPKRGESWAETIKKISELDGPTIAQMWDTQAQEFDKLPAGISVKMLSVMSVFASMLREPSPGLWKETMDRADGKVKEQVELSGSVSFVMRESSWKPKSES